MNRYWGRVRQVKFVDKKLTAIVDCTNGMRCLIPGQLVWFPGLTIEFGGNIAAIDEIGYHINVKWSIVGELNV